MGPGAPTPRRRCTSPTTPRTPLACSTTEAYGAGDHERAVAGFLSAVSGLDWETCQAVIEHVPGGVAQAMAEFLAWNPMTGR
jgi:hypothetical protein